ncbi:hypothetical protein PGT21_024081 [Puccinia graminis f. sp. tritici]|uniref:GH18 domain-containing protein n=1 Tax=Puccinia graminis f. sp. tritici TaxID=56615 RepID=A0A5B0M336_PUCGR|nr:hypothetical protein PGT21_024081 [Puccinia graminis f. sp. tritici]
MRSSSQVFLATGLLSALFLGSSTHAYSANNRGSPQVKAYYPSYNFEAQPVSKIDWTAYTDLLYFMVIPQPDFTLSYDPKLTRAQGEKLVTEFVAEARKNNVNALFSAGGWTGSRHFSNLTSTETSRKKFAQVLVNFGQKHGFAGIEMDWEYANGDGIGCNSRNPADVVNFGLLVKEIRALWPHASITAALGISGFNGADGKNCDGPGDCFAGAKSRLREPHGL